MTTKSTANIPKMSQEDLFRLKNIKIGDRVKFRTREGKIATDEVAGWSGGTMEKRIILKSTAVITLSEVISRVKHPTGEELVFSEA